MRIPFLGISAMNKAMVPWRETTIHDSKTNKKERAHRCLDRTECGSTFLASIALLAIAIGIGLIVEGRTINFDLAAYLDLDQHFPDFIEAHRTLFGAYCCTMIGGFMLGGIRAAAAKNSNARQLFVCCQKKRTVELEGGSTTLTRHDSLGEAERGCLPLRREKDPFTDPGTIVAKNPASS
jgi:hypothetical protein